MSSKKTKTPPRNRSKTDPNDSLKVDGSLQRVESDQASVAIESTETKRKHITELTSILIHIGEEVRSQQLLFFPTIALAITIPLGAIAAEHLEYLRVGNFGGLPMKPGLLIFFLWFFGTITAGAGAYFLTSGSEELDSVDSLGDVTNYLTEGDEQNAARKLIEAFNSTYRRLSRMKKARWLFYASLGLFFLCVAVQLLLVLFCSLTVLPPSS